MENVLLVLDPIITNNMFSFFSELHFTSNRGNLLKVHVLFTHSEMELVPVEKMMECSLA